MKTKYVCLLVAVFGVALLTAIVSINSVSARAVTAGTVSEDLFAGLRWRNIGPFSWRAYFRCLGRDRSARHILFGRATRRSLENDKRRCFLVPNL
jgi:hypothetical protein